MFSEACRSFWFSHGKRLRRKVFPDPRRFVRSGAVFMKNSLEDEQKLIAESLRAVALE
jgi:hypothetical protein